MWSPRLKVCKCWVHLKRGKRNGAEVQIKAPLGNSLHFSFMLFALEDKVAAMVEQQFTSYHSNTQAATNMCNLVLRQSSWLVGVNKDNGRCSTMQLSCPRWPSRMMVRDAAVGCSGTKSTKLCTACVPRAHCSETPSPCHLCRVKLLPLAQCTTHPYITGISD